MVLVVAILALLVSHTILILDRSSLARRCSREHADAMRLGAELIAAHNDRTRLANKLTDAYNELTAMYRSRT